MGCGNLVDLEMSLNAMTHLNFHDEEASTIVSSSGHESNVSDSAKNVHNHVELHYINEDIFYDM